MNTLPEQLGDLVARNAALSRGTYFEPVNDGWIVGYLQGMAGDELAWAPTLDEAIEIALAELAAERAA